MISAKRILQSNALLFVAILAGISLHAQTVAKASFIKSSPSQSYSTPGTEALSIGDKIPDVKFNEVVNYKTKRAKFSQLKKKLTILDFWSTSCSACIKLFPHMQSLQDEFKDQLQIILVNGKTQLWQDNEAKAKRILDRLKTNAGVDIYLPIVMNCEELDGYFPWVRIPHEVWIDQSGTVIAITGAAEVNASNIQAILDGKKVSMRTKNDISFDLQKQTLAELIYSNSVFANPISCSIFIKGQIDGLGNGQGLRHADSPYSKLYSGLFIKNMPLNDIYKSIYRDKLSFPDNQIFIESKDSLKFKAINYDDTSAYSNVYSYDITVPPINFDDLLMYAQQDLEKTFHVTVLNEKRTIKCLVVRSTFQLKSSFTKGGDQLFIMDELSSKKYVRNYPMKDFLSELNRKYFNVPLLDETGLTVNVDIDMPSELTQENIIAALKSAGFDIREEQREIKVAIIKDK